MVSLYSVTFRYWSRLRHDRRFQLKASVMFFFVLSLVFSLGDGPMYSFGWITLGLTGFALLYRLQERYFFVSLWLSIVYAIVFLGSMTAFRFAELTGNWFLQIFGYSILVGAFIGCLFLILMIKERRDLIALEGEYVPIGLWSALVLLFFWSSVFSILGFIRWADGSLGNPGIYLSMYITAELILIPTFIFVVTFPDEKFVLPDFDKVHEKSFFRDLAVNLTFSEFRKRIEDRQKEAGVRCPSCNDLLLKEIKKCPTCDSPRYFYWCNTSQDYFVRCPSCRMLTPVGPPRCINCSARMSSRIRCSKCRDVNRISEWT
ncbi:MAG: hypothetical protein ACMUIE_07595 [Thermoplasmatota archaeon]